MRKLKLAALGGGLATIAFVLALAEPASQLFSLHMSQHLLLIAVAAPLLVLGGLDIPMPPLASWAIFVGIFLFWHWPTAFQWAALHPLGEFLELGSILVAACCFWSGIFQEGRASAGARALLVMTAAVVTDLPGVVMLFAPRAICVMPNENAARFGLGPLEDQQIAGLLMWVPTNLVFFAIATFLFARWIANSSSMVTS